MKLTKRRLERIEEALTPCNDELRRDAIEEVRRRILGTGGEPTEPVPYEADRRRVEELRRRILGEEYEKNGQGPKEVIKR